MRRRALLSSAVTATALGNAGCIAGLGSRTVDAGDTVTLDGVDFEVGDLRLQSTFVEQGEPFWNWDAVANPDGQYAVVPLRPQNDDPDQARKVLRNGAVAATVDGETQSEDHHVNEEDYADVRLGVPIPDGTTHDDAAVVFGDSARYPLSADQLDVLADPPRYSIDVTVPDEFDGMQLPVALEVTNDGDNHGTVAWTTTHSLVEDGWYTEQVTVLGGETETSEFVHDRLRRDTGEEIGVTVDYGYDDVSKTAVATD